jgi:pimeloyl-ACP methyl ester carboxylesterase
MIEKEIIVKNLKINYKIFGSGRPFLILHGWGSSSERWEKVSEMLSKIGLMVIVPDLPGFGKSQEPDSAWSLDNYVEWLLEYAQKIPELQNGFYLLGHSFGGAVAVKFSIKYAQKVRKLFLISAAAIRKKTIKKQVLGRISKFFKLFSFFPFYGLAKKSFYRYVVRGDDYLKSRGVMKETFLKAISEDLSAHLNFIRIPTVIIWGDNDEATLVQDAYFINKKIENSKLIILPNGKHSLHLELPEILSQKIIENL